MAHRYPDPKEPLDFALLQRLGELPCGKPLNLAWVKSNLCPDAVDFDIPPSSVIRGRYSPSLVNVVTLSRNCSVLPGMQANMFCLAVKTAGHKEETFVCKRIAPIELPDKKDLGIWRQFLASVRREIEFYQVLIYYNMSVKIICSTILLITIFVSADQPPTREPNVQCTFSFLLIDFRRQRC